jgi:hypothetical protein
VDPLSRDSKKEAFMKKNEALERNKEIVARRLLKDSITS